MFTRQNTLELKQVFCFNVIGSTSLVTRLARIRLKVTSGFMMKIALSGLYLVYNIKKIVIIIFMLLTFINHN